MGKIKRLLSLCLALALSASLFAGTAVAVPPEDWAQEAVNKLNTLYGGGFAEDYETQVTVGDLKSLLETTFDCTSDGYIGLTSGGDEDDDPVTRGVLAHTVAKLFKLGDITGADESDKIASAIEICKSTGIMSGYPDGSFGEDEPVTHAQLAAVFYRAVNKAAGSAEVNQWGLKPGAYGYDELLYFAVRQIPYGDAPYDQGFEDLEITVWDDETESDVSYGNPEDVWNQWQAMLNAFTDEEGAPYATTMDTLYGESGLDGDATVVDAAVAMVQLYREGITDDRHTEIFYDLPAFNPYYEGLMYLLNQKIVMGYGNGTFRPFIGLSYTDLAGIVLRVEGVDIAALPTPYGEDFTEVFPEVNVGVLDPTQIKMLWAAYERDYFLRTDFVLDHNEDDDIVTRGEMAYAAVKLYGGYDENAVNTGILARFADGTSLAGSPYEKPFAYLVSIGLVNGALQEDGIYLDAESSCTRGMAGVFVARVLQGLDRSKMRDYQDAVDFVMGGEEE